MVRIGFLCILTWLLQTPDLRGGAETAGLWTSVSTVSVVSPKSEPPWAGRIFLAGGYGYPQGVRADLGWNIGRVLFAGVTFGVRDHWSRDPEEGSVGFFGGLHLPVSRSAAFTPYLLVGNGGTVAIFGRGDSYTYINLGAMLSMSERVVLRPEVSLCFTSRAEFVSSWGIFGTLTEKKRTIPGANLVIELDL